MIEDKQALKTTIRSAINNSFGFDHYKEETQTQVKNGSTSGPKQTEELAYYTKLNAQRMKRIEKTVALSEKMIHQLRRINQPVTWLLITETWCGDAANAVPVLAAMAKIQPMIDLKLVYRDENLDLMDQFLTNGGRSIPKLIMLDQELRVLATWGPRPDPLQKIYLYWKNDENKVPYKEFQVTMQQWYNADKGTTIQQEIGQILENLQW